ncbi:Putative ParB-like nuclease [Rhodomicrobium vannielii ATCC 17100]|uniref:Putative ParB-like nuclease n=1 Tax=Rhodomicrobium vannielii (strain ATCC 17100 / DSM 162 / LMG 4299 / NCIMB 10020 / ATH 3.1.1) TaxID=648757 RepID=E3HZR1_RHOVT|nr:ParB-like protein [Rhodomicrobium vannielii]ADP72171.1 Putative ParB-like nuclease [Rhodomicrobium vannielii ATCC 17100]
MLLPNLGTPVFHTVSIADLRPTQMTVGRREVESRAARLEMMARDERNRYLAKHAIPVVKGPKGRLFAIDRHHLLAALLMAGAREVPVRPVFDFRDIDNGAFFEVMDSLGLLHPFDDEGCRREYDDIPPRIDDMIDDPFRSLAGALRREGAYSKDRTPFSEFLWADFLRRRIERVKVETQFETALAPALELAGRSEARDLPGWHANGA